MHFLAYIIYFLLSQYAFYRSEEVYAGDPPHFLMNLVYLNINCWKELDIVCSLVDYIHSLFYFSFKF